MSLTAEQRRALVLLARSTHGATEALMLAHGFRRETLARLVLAGLTTVVTETNKSRRYDGQSRTLPHYDDGRRALES
jgi:hypothetical protein